MNGPALDEASVKALPDGAVASATRAHEPAIEDALLRTPAGMRHFASTGPADRTCRECQHACDATRTPGTKWLKDIRCDAAAKVMACQLPRFSHATLACKYFEEAERPLQLCDPHAKAGR